MAELNVRIENKQYIHGTNVLDNIEFNLAAGEFVAIIGPSGCGKTTLLNMISGLEPSEAGSIVFEGERF